MIGFTSESPKALPQAPDLPKPNALLNFDSGRFVSFADALLHTLVLGTTGSGKTKTIIIPAIKAHIEAGHSGLIVDIKGNFTDYVRSIAINCAREKDIVEFGISKSAHTVNILETMTADGFHNFCMNIISTFCEGKSNNMDFHAHGASMARDVFRMLKEIAAYERKNSVRFTISPTLPLILELFNDPVEASKLFSLYVAHVADRQNITVRKFIRQVQHSRFHILNQDGQEKGSTHREQISYATHGMIMALKGFLDEEGIESKFCGNCAPGIPVDELVEDGKLILLRFGTAAGSAAAQISRLIINSFYNSIYKLGLKNPAPRFVCIDEFQEVADLSAGKYSDANFVSLAREFGCGFLGATQSLSALVAKSSLQAVEGFISNCNQKIFLYSEDPLTRDAAKRYDSRVELIDLKTDQAFAATYDVNTREHRWAMDGLSWSYKSCAELKQTAGKNLETCSSEISLETVYNFVKEVMKPEDQSAATKKPEFKKKPVFQQKRRIMPYEDYEEICEAMEDAYMPDEDFEGTEHRKRETEIKISDFQIDFPLLFENNAQIVVPSGWREFTRRALTLYSEMGLTDKITSLKLHHSRLVAEGQNRREGGIEILNKILSLSTAFCIKCGKLLSKDSDTHLCEDCLRDLGLPPNFSLKSEPDI